MDFVLTPLARIRDAYRVLRGTRVATKPVALNAPMLVNEATTTTTTPLSGIYFYTGS